MSDPDLTDDDHAIAIRHHADRFAAEIRDALVAGLQVTVTFKVEERRPIPVIGRKTVAHIVVTPIVDIRRVVSL